MINVGIIGCGHWGPNYIRIFSQLKGSRVLKCSDLNEDRLKYIQDAFSDVSTTQKYHDILDDPDIDAVCVATPTSTHYQITKEALNRDKHVLCEKPLTMVPSESLDLKELAEKRQRILMVGHIFLFNAGIKWLKAYIDSGELGDIHYAYATRTNLGPFRYDVNAMWDLAPHDISIFNYLFDQVPVNVSARGQKCLGNSQEDLAFCSLAYPDNRMANIHVSWIDPKKVRQITIVGDKKMVVWDDLASIGPIQLYDKHVERTDVSYATYGDFQLLSKEGSVIFPKIPSSEPLKNQAEWFLNSIEKNVNPDMCDAQKGYDVVKTLCAIQKSMDHSGQAFDVDTGQEQYVR